MNALADSLAPERPYLDAVLARKGELPGAGVEWVDAFREKGAAILSRRGFPNRRVETWKYSDLRAALSDEPFVAGMDASAGSGAERSGPNRIVFVNGRLARRPSVKGAMLLPLSDALNEGPGWVRNGLERLVPKDDHALFGMNAALMSDGFALCLPKGVSIEKPIDLTLAWSGGPKRSASHLRFLIIAEEGARATVIERHLGDAGTERLISIVMCAHLAKGAALTHVKLQGEEIEGRHLALLIGEIAADARFQGFIVAEGAAFMRNEAHITLRGQGARASFGGVALVGGSNHCDITTVIRHADPRAESRQQFKYVLASQGRGVFQGQVSVAPHAVGTDAQQLVKSLLISPRAEMNAKPELEIFADDVKCSHGAASGDIDEAALFYLRARGIGEQEARALLVRAFLEEIVESLPADGLKEEARSRIVTWLEREIGS